MTRGSHARILCYMMSRLTNEILDILMTLIEELHGIRDLLIRNQGKGCLNAFPPMAVPSISGEAACGL